jgi:myo-inositol 2-dehydrogenase / D-chiro-inositol 1-dehydrogenase
MSPNSNDCTSRRDFMKTSTAAAVGTGLLGGLALSPRLYAAGDDTIRIGLVGCGGRGIGAVGDTLKANKRMKLVAAADIFEDRLESGLGSLERSFHSHKGHVAVDRDHRFSGFDGYQKVLASDIDLVILATPPGFRPIHFEAAVNAGKNIFTEKPLGVDGPGVRRVLAANEIAKSRNLKIGVGLQRHHQPMYLETLQRLRGGDIGDIVALRVYWNGRTPWDPRKTREQCKCEMEYQIRNWYYYVWLCGDHIVEQHIHNLDVGNWFKGDHPVRCWGMGGRQVRTDKKYGEIFDHHMVEYEYADGTRMFSQCRQQDGTWTSVSEHAIGSKGTADIADGAGAKIKVGGKESWRYKHEGRPALPYQIEHADLVAAIRENRSYNEVEYGAHSTLTAIMGRMATYSGKEVDWDAALNSKIDLMPERFAWDAQPKVTPLSDGSYPVAIPGVTKAV